MDQLPSFYTSSVGEAEHAYARHWAKVRSNRGRDPGKGGSAAYFAQAGESVAIRQAEITGYRCTVIVNAA
jgi:hypothetical protein